MPGRSILCTIRSYPAFGRVDNTPWFRTCVIQAMDSEQKKRLSIWLSIIMVFAMLMGPGPGLRLVNPDISDPAATYVIFGIPVIYAWGILWFFVQMTLVIVAYRTIWVEEDDALEDSMSDK